MPKTHKGAAHSRKQKSRKSNRTWIGIGLGAIVIVAAAFLLLRQPKAASQEISAAQAYAKYQQGIFFLDVRTQEEWDQEHIAHSTLIPLDELQNRLGELLKDQEIVVVCHTGVRSKEGMAILLQAGFTRVTCLAGGLEAWKAAGYPLEEGAS